MTTHADWVAELHSQLDVHGGDSDLVIFNDDLDVMATFEIVDVRWEDGKIKVRIECVS